MALKQFLKSLGYLHCALVLFVFTNLVVFSLVARVRAAELDQRSITISSAIPSATVTNFFRFIYENTDTLGSIAFDYCDNSPLVYQPCSPPPGLDVSNASLDSQSGNNGFTLDTADTTANRLVIMRIPSAASAITPSTYSFSNIVNPSDTNHTVFVRITTYPTTDGSGAFGNNGTVAFATAQPFSVGADVPPFLKLCVGLSVTINCSSAIGDSINFGTLSPAQVSAATSQFVSGTNADNGFSIFVLGTTMTSGNNVIAANAAPAPSQPGKAQFGLNLRSNSNPPVGSDPSGIGTTLPTSNYSNPNQFMFNNGDLIASDNIPSDFTKMTASYVVNVPGGQSPGVYSTTLTYLATAQF